MFKHRRHLSLSLFLVPLAFMNGCASTEDVVNKQEEFASTGMFARSVPGPGKASCEAARRALLSQGYVISESNDATVRGRRKFQPNGESHVEIEFNVVCAPNSEGSNSTTIFANAVRDRYTLKKNSTSASLGVGILGSVSLPIGASNDSLVKVGSETIFNGQLYRRFFELVERYLDYVPAKEGNADDSKDIKSNAIESKDIAP